MTWRQVAVVIGVSLGILLAAELAFRKIHRETPRPRK